MWPVLILITRVNFIASQCSQGEVSVAEPEDFNTTLCWLCSYTFSVSALDRLVGYLRSGKDFSSSQERHWKVSKSL